MPEAFDSRTGKWRGVYARRTSEGGGSTTYFSKAEYNAARQQRAATNAAQRARINNAVGGRVV